MKLFILTLSILQTAQATHPAQNYSNGSSNHVQKEEEEDERIKSLKTYQERMEERRGWKGSSIEPVGSKTIENDDSPKDKSKDD